MDKTDYIAGVEKAISEKYGEDASRDIRYFWDKDKEKMYKRQLKRLSEKSLEEGRNKEQIEKNGYLLLKKNRKSKLHVNCPLCSERTQKIFDDIKIEKYECCQKCFIDFVEGREDRWMSGWRPDKEILILALKRRKNNG